MTLDTYTVDAKFLPRAVSLAVNADRAWLINDSSWEDEEALRALNSETIPHRAIIIRRLFDESDAHPADVNVVAAFASGSPKDELVGHLTGPLRPQTLGWALAHVAAIARGDVSLGRDSLVDQKRWAENTRSAIASTTHLADPDVALVVTSDRARATKTAAASNQHLHPVGFDRLARSKDRQVLRCLASNRSLPVHWARSFAAAGDPHLRSALAQNPGVTDSALIDDLFADHAKGLAHRGDVPSSISERLVTHPETDVRRMYAAHVPIAADAFERLANDPSSDVRHTVAWRAANPALLDQLAGDVNESVRSAVARNAHTQEVTLRRLTGDPSSRVRRDVASNKNAPIEAICDHARTQAADDAVTLIGEAIRSRGYNDRASTVDRVLAYAPDLAARCSDVMDGANLDTVDITVLVAAVENAAFSWSGRTGEAAMAIVRRRHELGWTLPADPAGQDT